MALTWRFAGADDLPLLAEMNEQLIADEQARTNLSRDQLQARLEAWLAGAYRAVLFERAGAAAAYALFCDQPNECYLRQFFVARACRRQGVGRAAMRLLIGEVFPVGKRLTVEVLTNNAPAVTFWHAMGYRDYSLKLEVVPVEGVAFLERPPTTV